MPSTKEYAHYIEHELLGFIPGITSKRMFGGWGFYREGYIFGCIVEDELYFKTSEQTEKEYEKLGSEPFVYDGHTSRGPVKMPYWKVPLEIQEDQERLEEWVNVATDVSRKK